MATPTVDLPVLQHPQLEKLAAHRQQAVERLAEARTRLTALAQQHHVQREANSSSETLRLLTAEMQAVQAQIEDLTSTSHALRAEYRTVADPIRQAIRPALEAAYVTQVRAALPYVQRAEAAVALLRQIADHSHQQGVGLSRCDTPALQDLINRMRAFLAAHDEE